MKKNIINTKDAPAALGPYSQAISTRSSNFIFISGQIPLLPTTMEIIDGDIKKQTHQVLKNLQAILKKSGCTLANVVKTTIYLQNMDDFDAVNEIYGQYFIDSLPARATVAVLSLPKNVKVEIDAIAIGD